MSAVKIVAHALKSMMLITIAQAHTQTRPMPNMCALSRKTNVEVMATFKLRTNQRM